jgi:protein-tyrosine phosphatase
MIDVHCHILPAIDDGPSNISESLKMAEMAYRDGITTIVATPHIKDRIHPVKVIQDKVDELNRLLTERAVPLKIVRGADVSALLPSSLLKDYTINETSYILMEFPHTHLPQNAGELLFNAIIMGLQPIITHPERNPSIVRNPHLLTDLIGVNSLVQVTAGSLTGYFGTEVQECAFYLLKQGLVHIIATDAHSNSGRIPVLSEGFKAAENIVGRDCALRLVQTNPASVIAGTPINVP